MEKDHKSCKSGQIAIPSHSVPLWWEKIAKVVNRAKFEKIFPVWWEKIGKVANRAKLAVLRNSEPPQWEKSENL